jgi:(2Fe-2S) ferredoxin
MYWTKRHVLVCNASHCVSKGANDVAGRLRLEIIRRKLDAEILINNCGTIDLCDIGPNLVVYPDNIVLSGVKLKDVGRVADFLAGGDPPQDLLLSRSTGAEEQRRAFYAEAVSQASPPADAEFLDLATRHGFDEAWISEQARRGFIARKPDGDGQIRVTVTSKARSRYGLA